jgi:hypothetical protein
VGGIELREEVCCGETNARCASCYNNGFGVGFEAMEGRGIGLEQSHGWIMQEISKLTGRIMMG